MTNEPTMIDEIDLNIIFRSNNARPIIKTKVKELSESINEIGLINPICVRRSVHHRGTTPFDAFDIVAGHHRYEAALALRWKAMRCIITEYDDLHAELAEIDENLIRSQLTPAQEASAVFRRKAIYEELHPETKAEAFKGNRHTGCLASDNLSFTSATADATGKDRRSVERAAARGEALGDDLAAVTGTSLDKGVELDALAKLPKDERKGLIDRAKAGETVTARKEPKIAVGPLCGALASEKQVTLLAQMARVNQPPREDTPILRSGDFQDILVAGDCKRIIEDVQRLAHYRDIVNVESLVEFLADENTRALETVHQGLAVALRIKAALDRAGLGAKPFLKTVV